MKPKAIIFLADGMADSPLPELGGVTPLEYARTPAMDAIAATGSNGTFLTLPAGLPTSSDVANMSVLGFHPENKYPGRGPIEAVSQDIILGPEDVAFRCNLVYVSPDGILKDFSAGHIPNDRSHALIAALQEHFGSGEVSFHAGVSYRNLLILHGKRFSDRVNYFKPDSSQELPLAKLRLSPADDSPEAAATVKFLIDLEENIAKFLAAHPLNAGVKIPANRIWPWSPGRRPALPRFSDVYAGRRGAIISAVDVIKGIAKCTDMEVIDVPGATGFLDTNYAEKAAAAVKAIRDFDLVYLHVEAIDECSHIGDLKMKLRAIEDFDAKIVAPVREALRGDADINFAVLPDHPVPIKLRKHTTTPVPVAICGSRFSPDQVMRFSETDAPQGALGFMKGEDIVRKTLGLA